MPKIEHKIFIKVLLQYGINCNENLAKFDGPFIISDQTGIQKFLRHRKDDSLEIKEIHTDHISINLPRKNNQNLLNQNLLISI